MRSSKRFLAAAAVSAALVTGGVAGFVLGVPGVSGAQTSDSTTPPSTSAPADDAPAQDGGAARDRENCPDKGGGGRGTGSAEGTATAISFRRL